MDDLKILDKKIREALKNPKIEKNEQNSDQVVAHIKLHARITKGLKTALVRGQFLRIGSMRANQGTGCQQGKSGRQQLAWTQAVNEVTGSGRRDGPTYQGDCAGGRDEAAGPTHLRLPQRHHQA